MFTHILFALKGAPLNRARISGLHFAKCKGIVPFLQNIIPRKKQKCEAKYFVTYTKVSSHNNNIQAGKITFFKSI